MNAAPISSIIKLDKNSTFRMDVKSKAKRVPVVLKSMTEPVRDIDVQEIWVNVTEGAEITGYHPDYVRKLARDNWSLPENERKLVVQRHSGGYMLWLPDLIDYMSRKHRTAQTKPKTPNT